MDLAPAWRVSAILTATWSTLRRMDLRRDVCVCARLGSVLTKHQPHTAQAVLLPIAHEI